MRWLINVPVWGERYRKLFIEYGLPSIFAAADYAGQTEIRFLFQTDNWRLINEIGQQPIWFKGTTTGIPHGKNSAERLGNACRLGLAAAQLDECVMFFNADMVISRETFAACERRFDDGKIFVTAHSVRVRDDAGPPVGASGRELSSWGDLHRHQWVDDCVYGSGHVAGPAIVVFETTDSAVAHCFSLQCLAVQKTREIDFRGPTCDELIDCFSKDEVHIVQEPDELAIIESCSETMAYDRSNKILNDKVIINFAPIYASPMMWWQFKHQIVIRGKPNEAAWALVRNILSRADQSKHPARLLPYSDQRIEAAKQQPAFVNYLLRIPQPIRHLVPKPIRKKILRWI